MSDPVSSQLISVIVPVYKVEKYLARGVDSIMGRPWTLSRFDLAESRFRRAAIYAKIPTEPKE